MYLGSTVKSKNHFVTKTIILTFYALVSTFYATYSHLSLSMLFYLYMYIYWMKLQWVEIISFIRVTTTSYFMAKHANWAARHIKVTWCIRWFVPWSHLRSGPWKLFGKEKALSKNTWQVIGWTICLSPSYLVRQLDSWRWLLWTTGGLDTSA